MGYAAIALLGFSFYAALVGEAWPAFCAGLLACQAFYYFGRLTEQRQREKS